MKLVPTTPTIGRLGCSTGGRASEAVDDNIGVARDDETTAGTDDDLVAGLVLPARPSSFGDESNTATGMEALFASRDLADGIGFSDRGAGRSVMSGSLMRCAITGLGATMGAACFPDVTSTDVSIAGLDGPPFDASFAAAAQNAAIAVTWPPRPPRADLTSY